MKWNLLIFWLFILSNSCSSSKIAVEEIDPSLSSRKYPTSVKKLEVDPLGSVYILDQKNKLTRYNTFKNTKTEYVDNRLGNIDDVDARNPLNIMVFFRQYGIVKILDNTLSPIKVISLQENESFQNVSEVCVTNDNQLWLFDENRQRIYKVDDNLQVRAETNRLSDLGLNNVQVVLMRENNNKLIVLVKDQGLFVFDNFGQFLRKISTNQYSDFQLLGNQIIQYSNCIVTMTSPDNPVLDIQNVKICEISSDIIQVKKAKTGWLLAYSDGVDVFEK